MEIERKFIPSSVPDDYLHGKCYLLEQAYIQTSPVIRIRQKAAIKDDRISASSYILTVKSSGMMTRQEFELPLTKEEYEELLTKASGNIIKKRRYVHPISEHLLLELDIFEDRFEGLVIAEIEFPDEDTAKNYTPSSFLGEEVTFDSRFHNSNLSKMSQDDIQNLLHALKLDNGRRNHSNGNKHTD